MLACVVRDSGGAVSGRSGTITVEWELQPGSKGHATAHVATQPSLKLTYNGETPQETGHNQTPASATNGNVTFNVSAADSLAAYQSYYAGSTSPAVSVYLPQSTQTASVSFTDAHCDYALGDDTSSVYTSGSIGFNVEMLVGLERVENITSLNGNSTLTVQRTGTPSNSHGNDAGYATSNNHARLIEVVENYSLCATHTSTDSYPLVTEGLSIRYGGHYDINRNFAGSHRNHRAGEDVDIGFSALSQAERNCLYLAYQDIYTTPVPGESLVLDEDGNAVPVEATHVHLWSGATHKYPRDQTQTFQQALLNYYCDVLGFCP